MELYTICRFFYNFFVAAAVPPPNRRIRRRRRCQMSAAVAELPNPPPNVVHNAKNRQQFPVPRKTIPAKAGISQCRVPQFAEFAHNSPVPPSITPPLAAYNCEIPAFAGMVCGCTGVCGRILRGELRRTGVCGHNSPFVRQILHVAHAVLRVAHAVLRVVHPMLR